MVIEGPGSKRGETGLHGQHVITQAWPGRIKGHPVAPLDMPAHLRAETEPEFAVGRLLEFHAVAAATNGLRGKATAMPVDSSRPGAA